MDRFQITGVSVALDAAGLADGIAYVDPGYVLTANDAGDDLAHLITILGNAATNHSAKTFTITGTGPNGFAQTEELAGPNGNVTVTSVKYFKTVTSVTVDSTTGADTFDIGWTANSVSGWVFPQPSGPVFNIGFACIKDSGSPTYGVQQTYDNGVTAFNHASVTNETTSQEGTYTSPVQGYRLNWTAAGGVTLWAYQVALK